MKSKRSIKSIVLLALLSILALFFISKSLAANTAKTNVETANLREKADTNSKILTLLPVNEEVEILGKEGDWYKVNASGVIGYLRQDIITLDGEEKPEVKTEENKVQEVSTTVEQENKVVEENKEQDENTANAVNQNDTNKMKVKENTKLKIIPAINATDIIEVKQDEEVVVTEKINGWVCVETSLTKGWIREDKLASLEEVKPEENTSNVQEPTTEPTVPVVSEVVLKTLYVNTELVNMRKEANTTSEVVSRLAINTEVAVYGEGNDWYKVKVGGKDGYIAASLLSATKQEVKKETNTTSRGSEKPRTNNETTTVAPSAIGSTVVETAKNYIGSKYVYGGSSPSGFDCSGFTSYVYRQHGVSLNRTAAGQYSNGAAVSRDNLQPGDLVMFGPSVSGINHVGIYIGGGQIVHASTPSTGVRIDSINSGYYSKNYVGARRVN